MYRLVSTGLETIAAAIILIPVLLAENKLVFHNTKRTIGYILFSLYFAAMYAVVGLPTSQYFRMDLSLNIIPFMGILSDLENSVLNVILFIPLGIFLPVLWNKFDSLKNTVLFGFGVTAAIEILQIFTLRTTDVNDVITNVSGTVIGYFVATVIKENVSKLHISCEKHDDVYILCCTIFVIMFFIQPLISSYLWSMILQPF